MIKKWIVIIAIIIFLAGGCVFEGIYTNKAFDSLEDEMRVVAKMISADQENIATEQNIAKIEEVHDKWHKKMKVLRCLIWHSNNKDIEVGISRAEWYIRENNYTEAIVEIYAVINYSEHLSNDFMVSIENIF